MVEANIRVYGSRLSIEKRHALRRQKGKRESFDKLEVPDSDFKGLLLYAKPDFAPVDHGRIYIDGKRRVKSRYRLYLVSLFLSLFFHAISFPFFFLSESTVLEFLTVRDDRVNICSLFPTFSQELVFHQIEKRNNDATASMYVCIYACKNSSTNGHEQISSLSLSLALNYFCSFFAVSFFFSLFSFYIGQCCGRLRNQRP